MATDQMIEAAVTLKSIQTIADRLGIPPRAVLPWGPSRAKISHEFLAETRARTSRGALVLVTGMTPTQAGEGKTTTTIGLSDALNLSGKRAVACLREPSLGPCFGVKGGATGGGRSQVAPSADINLHFTGDFHAVTSAHALLSAMLDNHLHWGNALDFDPRRITWRRAVDMNDRALRSTVSGLGSVTRQDGFDITVASEVMAILCLSRDLSDLRARLKRIVLGRSKQGGWLTAADLKADAAMAALLRDAAMPNLVQTLEGNPALIHGGPFANIAHGCSSVAATSLGLSVSEIVVTEAGFGADLGGEKFLDIKCPSGGFTPDCAVIVATVRALKMHGGVSKRDLHEENVAAVVAGLSNLNRHIANLRQFGLPVVVALNRFASDTDAERAAVSQDCATTVVGCTHFTDGGAGALDLAHAVQDMIATSAKSFAPLYSADLPLNEKIEVVARRIYRAQTVTFEPGARRMLEQLQPEFGLLPVCIAKTQYSFTADPTRVGAPVDFDLPIRDVRLSAGAGMIVALAGTIMTMPGLPRRPAAEQIGLDDRGQIVGLM